MLPDVKRIYAKSFSSEIEQELYLQQAKKINLSKEPELRGNEI